MGLGADMGSNYGFVSPGGMAGNAIQEFLMQREQQERMRILDALEQKAQADRVRLSETELGLRQSGQDQQAREFASDEAYRTGQVARQREQDDIAGDERRQRQNQIGIVQMMGDAYTQAGDPMRGMAVQAGVDLPPDPDAELRDYEAKRRIDARYRPRAAAAGPSNEPLVAIMGPDGESVLVPRSQAVGKKPANMREQGRSVTSGDAGRIAEFDTSLDDTNVLERDLGKTGAGSQIGAMLPNVVTEYTGLGMDSKQRQAVIDRVKQVIGKALEGGVLRKEDEAKYAKILPTIGDAPEVAKTKIDGLRAALEQRRGRFIDSLSDAGFETDKYTERQPKTDGGGVVRWTRDANGRPVRAQ
jgi:hypothetical protein